MSRFIAKKRVHLRIADVAAPTDSLGHVAIEDLMPIRDAIWEEKDWTPISDSTKANFACDLDDTAILPLPRPKNKAEENELVEKFLRGVEKLFTVENNWTMYPQLVTTMEHCAQCNTCSEACHIYLASGRNELYRPTFRSEIFRRLYKKHVKKELLSAWRNGDVELTWRTVARLGEMSYRCNLCRRCAQTCPIGADNDLIAREIRKIFSQELGIAPAELHEKGSMRQMKVGSSTGMSELVVKDNVEFIDEEFTETTGYEFKTPWDKEGADILLMIPLEMTFR